MTRVVIASDSFKGSASSKMIAEYITKGIKRVDNTVEILPFSIADGGEGTVTSLVESLNGEYELVEVKGPYNQNVMARYGVLGESKAIIEMAEASGLPLKSARDSPRVAHTYGTGQLIKAAMDKGIRELFIGLGGSATNDGGAGMAQALGVKFLDQAGQEIGTGLDELKRIHTIDCSQIDSRIKNCRITILSDVTNPLIGNNGATAIFGSQKGIEESEINELDFILERYAKVVEKAMGCHYINVAGAGAAGGLGFGLMAFCRAEMASGIDAVLKLIELEKVLTNTDLVITGEGRMDGQSTQGKAPIGVAKLAKKYHLPVIAVVGGRDDEVSKIYEAGIDLIIDIVIRPMLLKEAIENVENLLIEAGETAFRAYKLNENRK